MHVPLFFAGKKQRAVVSWYRCWTETWCTLVVTWGVLIFWHGLRMPREEIAFTAWPKIQSQSQIFRYGRSIFCLPHRPNFSYIFDLCLQWAVSSSTLLYWIKLVYGLFGHTISGVPNFCPCRPGRNQMGQSMNIPNLTSRKDLTVLYIYCASSLLFPI